MKNLRFLALIPSFLLINSCTSANLKRTPANDGSTSSSAFNMPALEANFKIPAIPANAPLKTLDSKNWSCQAVNKIHDARLEVCKATTENTGDGQAKMNVLTLKGDFATNAYDHGYLLASEIETGSLSEALDNIKKMDTEVPPAILGLAHKLLACYEHKIAITVDDEFKSGVKELYHGYSDRMIADGKTPKYTLADIETATYSIEVGNIFYSMLYQGGERPLQVAGQVLSECGIYVSRAAMQELWERIFKTDRLKHKFACSGFVLPQTETKDGHFYHGRNLEQTGMIESWNRNPVTFIVAEPNHYKYVAFGTAGLIFPGGISGYNEKGLSVSTHQMDPARYSVHFKKGTAALGPYLQQRVLREASNLDEALKVAQSAHNYAAWTILASDSKTGQAESIEVTKNGAVIGAHSTASGLAQSNHFENPANLDLIFHDTYNYYLETLSRHQWIDHVLKSGKQSFPDMLSLMSSHVDWYAGNVSLGRSVARVMNIFSSVVSPDQNKVWVTLSDRMPSNEGYYLGFKVDFDAMKLTPFEAVRVSDRDNTPNFNQALAVYQKAYRAKNAGDAIAARQGVEEALALAQKDGIDDLNFRMVIAHFLLNEKNNAGALVHLKALEDRISDMHPLQRAQLRAFQLYADDQATSAQRDSWYQDAKSVLDYSVTAKEGSNYFPVNQGGFKAAYKDLEHRLKVLQKIYERKEVKLSSVDMRTGE